MFASPMGKNSSFYTKLVNKALGRSPLDNMHQHPAISLHAPASRHQPTCTRQTAISQYASGRPPMGHMHQQTANGQDALGRPPNGQDALGRPPNGQDALGRPPNRQDALGRPPMGHMQWADWQIDMN
jgi:hypothetical protein